MKKRERKSVMAAEDTEKTYPESTEVLPTPAGEPLEASEGEAPAGDGAEGGKKRKRVALVDVAALAAAALVGAAAWAVIAQAPDAPAPAAEEKPAASEQKKDAAKSEIKVTIAAEGAEAAAAKAKAKIVKGGKDVAAEGEVACNEAVAIGGLERGDYELVVTSAPVLEDGTTYRLPDAPAKFSVEGEGEPVAVECALSKIAKEDMSKEQLEAAAAILDGAGKADAASAARASAEVAPSKPGSAASVRQGAQQHRHSYSIPIYGNGAPIYGNGGPIIVEHCYCSICGEITGAEYSGGHLKQHALAGVSASSWIDEIVVRCEQIVTGYEQVVVGYVQVPTGYKCSCGAVK